MKARKRNHPAECAIELASNFTCGGDIYIYPGLDTESEIKKLDQSALGAW